MCGFAGVISRNESLENYPLRNVLAEMGRQIEHRGPDDEQYYQEDKLGLVFRRLAIVDLQTGAQPITNEDNSLVLVANGEIYNHLELKSKLKNKHTFTSHSDCEVIIHLYEEMGDGFLTQLNGMFALTLWDKRLQKLIIARDRLGIKPLYYNINDSRIIFASEIKALLPYPDCPREFDWEAALAANLSHVKPNYTLSSFFKGIQYLKGGEYLIYDYHKNAYKVKEYWKLSPLSRSEYESDTRSEAEIIEGYKAILEDSVKLQLMTDVGIGLFLSGGIDSVVVAYLAAKYQRIPTFSVLSQSTFKNGDAKYAHLAAAAVGLENHQVLYKWHDNTYDAEYWKRLVWQLETPFCEAEHLYKNELHRFARNTYPNLKSILTGQGSDEFNGGYCDVHIGAGHPCYQDGNNNWDVFMDSMRKYEKSNLIYNSNSQFSNYFNFIKSDFLAERAEQEHYEHPWFYHANMYTYRIQMYNLWHEDRTAAGNHIENRVPFLDHRLVEYTMKVPPRFYKNLFWNKQILRKAFAGSLPDAFVQRPKVPFYLGEDERYTYRMLYNILTRDNQALILEALGEPDSNHPVFERKVINDWVSQIAHDTEFSGVRQLITIVNMGVLDKIASTSNSTDSRNRLKRAPERVEINDWDKAESHIATELGIRRRDVSIEKLLKLPDNVQLLNDKCNNIYILINNKLEYLLESDTCKSWIDVLSRIDGKKSLRNILDELSIEETGIRVHLEEALDFKIVELC